MLVACIVTHALPDADLCSVVQVLIKVHAAGVNPVDTYIRSGAYARLPDLPYTPGVDAAGIIETVGRNVDNVQVASGF